jgi:hypothetical protein
MPVESLSIHLCVGLVCWCRQATMGGQAGRARNQSAGVMISRKSDDTLLYQQAVGEGVDQQIHATSWREEAPP